MVGGLAILSILLLVPSPQTTEVYIDLQCEHYPVPDLDFSNPQTENILIVWEKDRLLTWGDFRGVPIEGIKIDACTHTWVGYNWNLEILNNSSHTLFKINKIDSAAYFRMNDSWVMPSVFDLENQIQIKKLKHEQGHFDIAEKYAIITKQNFTQQFVGKTFPVTGSTYQEQLDNADMLIRNMLNNEWNKIHDNWGYYEGEYDKQTNHMWNFEIQDRYSAEFDSLRN